MSYCDSHPFDRSGAGALSDFATPEWRALFNQLEQANDRFRAHEAAFRSPDYPWPRDPLHDWSRSWEYPYAYHQLATFRRAWTGSALPVVVDVGCGVTFFPFAVAALGYDVRCTDTDPICRTDLGRAIPLVEARPGRVEFGLIENGRLPLADGAAAAVFCISVVEHIPQFEATVREMARVLQPGGLLVLTNDLDLRGDHEIGIPRYQDLRRALRRDFEPVHPEVSVHPADLLRTANGPYPSATPQGAARAWFQFKQRLVKPLLGRPPRPLLAYDLAVQAFTLRRHT